jgi:glycogen debranching enzyme
MMGDTIEAGRWQREAEHTKRAVNSRMWDLDTAMYYDCDARTLNRIAAKPSTSFYPFLTDIAGVEQVAALRKHLLNSREFWTEYPVPSVSIDDPYFDAEPSWKGKRHSCPWSGRTWPMTNSHIVDALARAGRMLDPKMRMHAVELMNRFITMMFHDRDVNRPNCYEHYNPHTGQPSEYRGYDDYQHSWVVDLIIKHVVGLLPQDDDTLVVDPLPFGLDEFTLDNVKYRGHDVRIVWRAHQSDGEPIGLTVYVDGKQAAHSDMTESLKIPV